MRAVIIVVLVGLSSIATAQPSLVTPTPVGYTPRRDVPEYKNPDTAMWLAIGGSVVGLGGIYLGSQMRDGDTPIMLVGGLISLVGPSAGDWWVRGGARFSLGFGARLAGFAVMGLGFGHALDKACSSDDECAAPIRDRQSDGLITAGAVIVGAGMLYDIVFAGPTAERHNERFQLTPAIVGNGVGVAGRF
jgi:hypothetical protein